MKVVDELYAAISAQIATPVDQVKLISILLLAIPLSIGLPKLPAGSPLIHVYSLLSSYVFHTQILHLHSGFNQLLGQSIGTWLAVKYCRSANKGKGWTGAIFIANMGILTVNHFTRWITNTGLETVEITGSQMVLVMKLTLFAWACFDGGRDPASLDQVQQKDRLVEVPGLLAFLGYAFYMPSVMTGPTFSYASYASFVDRSLFMSQKGKETVIRMPKGRYRKAGKRVAIAAVYLAIYAVYGGKFSYTRLNEADVQSKSFLLKLGFTQIAGFIARTKYYGVWSFAETAMIVSGLGYDAQTGKWNRGRNVMIRQIESAQNFKLLLDAWNCGTNYWLRECVYKRLGRPGKKPGFKSTMATFATSAFWHGFNPTYYITFILGGLLQGLGRKLRTNLRPLFLPVDYALLSPEKQKSVDTTIMKRLYDLLSTVTVQLALNFTVIPFLLLEVKPTLQAWETLHYYGLFMCFLPYAFFQFGGGKFLRGLQKQRAQRAGISTEAVDKQRKEAKNHISSGVTFAPDVHHAATDELKEKKKQREL